MDSRFRGAVARGLAQRTPDLTTFALAASLARSGANSIVDCEGCAALGAIAARDFRAFRKAVVMFLDSDVGESLRGSEALAHTMDMLPGRVGHIVRFRLRRELLRPSAREREPLARRLARAINPLYRIEHREAASVARTTLDELTRRVDISTLPDVMPLLDTIDLVRGQVIPYEDGDSLEGLLRELGADDVLTRFRAAAVLRSLNQAVPERVVDPLCKAIRREHNPYVLGRLLLGTYRILEIAPAKLLQAVSASRAVAWNEPYPTGAALALLGHAARVEREMVFGLLPRRLDGIPPWARACLAEVLAFAWWRLAEVKPEARSVLESLQSPNLSGVSRSFRVFAERGASISALGLLSLGAFHAGDTTVSMTRDTPGPVPYLYTDTRGFFLRHVGEIAKHPHVEDLAVALLRVVRAGHGLPDNHRDERLRNAQRIAAQNSLDELIEIVSRQEDPLSQIRDLPRDWEAIYGARKLLRAGVRSEGLIEFAQAACDEHAGGGTVSAVHERNVLLDEIALTRDDSREAVVARIAGQSSSFLGAADSGRAHGMASYIDSHPEDFPAHVDAVLAEPEGVLLLFSWRTLARDWRAILVSDVFGRMFDSRTISYREAIRLVDQMREVVRSLPDSRVREENELVYGAIGSWLKSNPVEITPAISPNTPVRASHAAVARLFLRANEARTRGDGAEWIESFLWDRSLWRQIDGYSIERGTLSRSMGGAKHVIYMLPALRLALVAVGRDYGQHDPAGRFIRARHDVDPRLSAAWTSARFRRGPAALELSLSELEGPDPSIVRDERVLCTAGHLLVVAGRLEEAEERLQRALASPMIGDRDRANAIYNLACVFARTGREEQCHEALEEALQLEPHFRNLLRDDEDLTTVRGREWFAALLPGGSTQA